MSALLKPSAHVVDVLGDTIGRDQPILRMDKAIEMVSLLSSDVFLDKNVVFFDPFCKAGELLFACSYMSCVSVLKKQSKLMDVKDIHKEIFESNRYFALAPDERHHRLSLRTFLGNTKSHDEKYNHIIKNGNYLSEIDGKLDENIFKKEFENMVEYIKDKSGNKRIIVVGNPPYQEADGGAKASAKPIYNIFVEHLFENKSINEFVLVIPARWFSSGKGLAKFRRRIMESQHVKNLSYFGRSEDVFPTVHVQGGVCFLNIDKDYLGMTKFIDSGEEIEVDLSRFDIIPDDPKASSIVTKVLNKHQGCFVSDIAWSRKPFGLPTNYFSTSSEYEKDKSDSVKCYTKGRKIKWIKRSNVIRHSESIDEWKVAIPRAYATGARRCTLPKHQIFLIEKGAISTETYNVIGSFENKNEALSLIRYLQTNFCRYLLGLRKLTQDIPKDRWSWVPLMEDLSEIDDKSLARYFDLTREEMLHLDKKIGEWS